MMPLSDAHANGQSMDDAIALLTSALGPLDAEAIREQIRVMLLPPERGLAAIEMLAVLGAGFIEALADVTGRPAERWLERLALRDQVKRPR